MVKGVGFVEYIKADKNGSRSAEAIISAIAEAKRTGVNRVKIEGGEWIVTKTVYLPSDIEIIIENAHLQLGDGTFINMFATENVKDKSVGAQKNITIKGVGKAVLDGGKYNGLSESNYSESQNPKFDYHISVNTMMFFTNTENLSVTGIKITNQRWWGITNVFVRDSEFKDIEFKANLSRADENGNVYDEIPKTYEETYVKNADGIDLRIGCKNIKIENISGFTEDDTVALTALYGFERSFAPQGASPDISGITIKNIASDCYYTSNVRLLCGYGIQIHDVEIDGVTDTREHDEYIATATVRIGDNAYAKESAKPSDIYNISVKNVKSKALSGVAVCKGLKDSVIENVRTEGGEAFSVFGEAVLESVRLSRVEKF